MHVTCSQCKTQIDTTKYYTSTGYGIDEHGNKICFDCCGKNNYDMLENMPVGGKTTLYLTGEHEYTPIETPVNGVCQVKRSKWYVTNWPGTLKIKVYYTRKGRHNIAGSRIDFWFCISGNHFHGVQYRENTEIAYIRRIKGTL